MSAKGSFWAWSLKGLTSAEKFVAVCLGDNHNADTNRCDPSAKYIAEKTELDVKTVRSALQRLEKKRAISIRNRPGKSPSFTLNFKHEHSEKKVYPKAGTPKIGYTQKRVTGIPKNGKGVYPKTGAEPKKNLTTEPKNNYLGNFDFSTWPSIPSEQVWEDYKKLRSQKRAKVSQTLITEFGKKLEQLALSGIGVDRVLSLAIERGWQGLEVSWVEDAINQQSGSQRTEGEKGFIDTHTDKSWAKGI